MRGSSINFDFLIKEDLICDFKFAQSIQYIQYRKVYAMSILQKIKNPIKFETFHRFRSNFEKKTTHILSTVIKNYLTRNLNLAELGVKMLFF